MSIDAGERLQKKIKQYKELVKKHQDIILQTKTEIDVNQTNIEQEVLNIMSNRKLSTKERTEQMLPLMDKQDRLKDFLEEIEILVIKENL